jgi:hypothetical protein
LFIESTCVDSGTYQIMQTENLTCIAVIAVTPQDALAIDQPDGNPYPIVYLADPTGEAIL